MTKTEFLAEQAKINSYVHMDVTQQSTEILGEAASKLLGQFEAALVDSERYMSVDRANDARTYRTKIQEILSELITRMEEKQ